MASVSRFATHCTMLHPTLCFLFLCGSPGPAPAYPGPTLSATCWLSLVPTEAQALLNGSRPSVTPCASCPYSVGSLFSPTLSLHPVEHCQILGRPRRCGHACSHAHTVLWLRLLCPGPVASEGTSLLGSWGGVQEQKQLCSSLCESYKFKMRTDKA